MLLLSMYHQAEGVFIFSSLMKFSSLFFLFFVLQSTCYLVLMLLSMCLHLVFTNVMIICLILGEQHGPRVFTWNCVESAELPKF